MRVYARDTATNTVTAAKDPDPCYSAVVGPCLPALVGAATSVVSSPDGKFVYAASPAAGKNDGYVAVFSRAAATGALTWLSCNANSPACAATPAGVLSGATGMTISADGKFVYVTSGTVGVLKLGTVSVFERNATSGKLTYKSCVADVADQLATGSTCATTAAGMIGAQTITISPDGLHAYVAANGSDSVAVFSRNVTTGALTPLLYGSACTAKDGAGGKCTPGPGLDGARAVAVSPNGKWVLVASEVSNAVAIFSRSLANGRLTQFYGTAGCLAATAGECAGPIRGLVRPSGMTMVGDIVTVATAGGAVVLKVNPDSGAVTQPSSTAGCVDVTIATCGKAYQVVDARSVAISDDGTSAYIVSETNGTVTVFDRNPTSGVLDQKSGADACFVRAVAGCTPAFGLAGARAIAITPDDSSVYVAATTDAAIVRFQRQVPQS